MLPSNTLVLGYACLPFAQNVSSSDGVSQSSKNLPSWLRTAPTADWSAVLQHGFLIPSGTETRKRQTGASG